MEKYSIDQLASKIGDLILFEDRDYETWKEVEICFAGVNAFITGVMYAHDLFEETTFDNADLEKVILQFTDDYSETDFSFDELVELEQLIKLYKI